MKTLLIIRHAKSSWANFGEADFDRGLNDRGKKDAPDMASRLLRNNIPIDLFVTSPAKRAKATCLAFCAAYGKDPADILFIDRLYQAPAHIFYDVIARLETEADAIAIFSHNTGITDFVNTLCDTTVPSMPTCAVFGVKADIKDWRDFENAKKDFFFYDFPKSGK